MDQKTISTLNRLKSPVIISDKDLSRIIFVNAAFCKRFNIDDKNFIKQKLNRLFDRQEIKDIKKELLLTKKNKKITFNDIKLKPAEGSSNRFNISFSLQPTEKNKFLRITLRDRIKKDGSTKNNYDKFIDCTHDAIMIIHPLDETILKANESAIKLYGYTHHEMIGMKISSLIENPEYERKVTNKVLSSGISENFENKHLSSDGKEIFLDINISRINYDGKNYIIRCQQDITSTKKNLAYIIKSEHKFKTLYENNPLINLTIDSTGKILSVNKGGAQQLGYAIKELTKLNYLDIIVSDNAETLDELLEKCMEQPSHTFSRDEEIKKKDGTCLWVRETVCAISGENKLPEFLIVFDDITNQKQTEIKAKSLAESLQRMLDASPLGVLVYRLDENDDLILITANDSAVRILNIDLYALISHKIQEIFPFLYTAGVVDKFKIVAKTGTDLLNQKMDYSDEHLEGSFEFSAITLAERTIGVFFSDITQKEKAISALTESETKYKTLFESSSDAIFVLAEDRFIDFNQKTPEILGTNKESLIDFVIYDFFPQEQSDERNSVNKWQEKSLSALNDKDQFFQFELLRVDKKLIYCEVHLNKIKLKGQTFLQVVARDISERKKVEYLLTEQKRELQTLMSNIPGMVYKCKNNLNWTMEFVSEGCVNLTGYYADDFINDSKLSYAEIIHKDDRIYVQETIQKAISRDEPFTIIYRIITSKGFEKWVWEKGRAIYDDNNNLSHLEGFITDITERIIFEEQTKILAHTLKSVTESVCITDMSDNIIFVNSAFCKTYGYEPDEIIGKNITVIRSSKNPSEIVNRILPDTLSGGWSGELINVKKNGEEFPISLSTSVIRDDNEKIIAHAGVIIDITDRKKNEAALQQAKENAEDMNRAKSNFLAAISHELRTPLAGMLGYAELLKEELTDPTLVEKSDRILNSGTRLIETLNSLLDISRIEAKKLELNLRVIKLSDFVPENLKIFEAQAKKKELYFYTEILNPELVVMLDEQMLLQVINNLVSNAIKYTNKGGVTVRVKSVIKDSKQLAEISVIDTGIGITDENINKIFDEYKQLSEIPEKKFEGSGLGLSLAKKLVDILSGELIVQSKIGQGSTFNVYFPTIKADVSKTNKYTKVEKSKYESILVKKLPEVLLVENDEASKEIVRLFLKNLCNITHVDNGLAAIELVKGKSFNAILMDINLGTGLTGVETTKEIKKLKNYEQVPVVALTAFAMNSDLEEFLREGCTHYISKPFRKKDLVDLIGKILYA